MHDRFQNIVKLETPPIGQDTASQGPAGTLPGRTGGSADADQSYCLAAIRR
jgi:hypothetical protein